MKIKVVKIDDILPLIEQLFINHREELATNKELMKLKPDIEKYRQLEQEGKLLILAVFDEGLIGYSVNFITSNLHYSDLLVCNNDLLYLDKAHRKAGIGLKLIKETEAEAGFRGAKLVLWHAKKDTALSSLLAIKGYDVQDIIYSRVL